MTIQPVFDGTPESAEAFLAPTYYVDSDAPSVVGFAKRVTSGLTGQTEKAIALFDAVRDGYRYDPYDISLDPEAYRASTTVDRSVGWCVTKTILLAAALRSVGIPAAVGFADVRNHLTTPKLHDLLGSDLFVYHGFAAIFLEGRWVKASSAFNSAMCERFGTRPLIFDGTADALLHEFDQHDRRHMEYIRERGIYAEPPIQEVIDAMLSHYPKLADFARQAKLATVQDAGFRPQIT